MQPELSPKANLPELNQNEILAIVRSELAGSPLMAKASVRFERPGMVIIESGIVGASLPSCAMFYEPEHTADLIAQRAHRVIEVMLLGVQGPRWPDAPKKTPPTD
jgi:hypothetical protein